MPDPQTPQTQTPRPPITLGLGAIVAFFVFLFIPQDVLFREVITPAAGLVADGATWLHGQARAGYHAVLGLLERTRRRLRFATIVILGVSFILVVMAIKFNQNGQHTTARVTAIIGGLFAGGYLFLLAWLLTALVVPLCRVVNGAAGAGADVIGVAGRVLSWFGLARRDHEADGRFVLVERPDLMEAAVKQATGKLAAGVLLSFAIFVCFPRTWVVIALMMVWLLGLLSASLRRVTGNPSLTGWKVLDTLTIWILGAMLLGIFVIGVFPSAFTGVSFAEADAWLADPTSPSGWKALRLLLIPMILAAIVLVGIAAFRGVGKDGKGKPYKSLALTLLGAAFLLGVFLYWNGTLKWEDFARDKGEVPKPVSRLYQKNFVRGGEQKVKEEERAEAGDSYVPGTGSSPSPAQVDRALDTLDDAMSVPQALPPRPVDPKIQKVLAKDDGAYDSLSEMMEDDEATN